jgi:phage/plasmid-associated DNA primase
LARAIYGDYRAKKIYFCVGSANAGKGLLTDAILNAFESFVGIFDANVLVNNERDMSDAAKKLAWVNDIADKRIVISNEIRMQKSMDGNIIKSIASGGDGLLIRQNFQDQKKVINRSTLFTFSNDIPKINPYDQAIRNRVRCIEYKKSFEDKESYIAKGGEIKDGMLFADKTLKDKFCNDNEYKDAVIWIIFDAYQMYLKEGHFEPESIRQGTEEWTGNENSIENILKMDYEITNDKTHMVKARELIDYIKGKHKVDMSETKIGKELNRLGLGISEKKVDGVKFRVRTGIRYINNECDMLE